MQYSILRIVHVVDGMLPTDAYVSQAIESRG